MASNAHFYWLQTRSGPAGDRMHGADGRSWETKLRYCYTLTRKSLEVSRGKQNGLDCSSGIMRLRGGDVEHP